MSDSKDEIIFVGSGLNSDDDIRFFSKGDSRERLNCLTAENGNLGDITNIPGNASFKTTDRDILWAIYYEEGQEIIYFEVDDVYTSYIKAITLDGVTTRIIASSTDLANLFDYSSFQSDGTDRLGSFDGRIIGDYLVYTSNRGEPKRVNIASSSTSANCQEETLELNKALKVGYPHAFTSSTDSTAVRLSDESYYQFAINYVYLTDEVTQLSEYSNVVYYDSTSPFGAQDDPDIGLNMIYQFSYEDQTAVSGVKDVNHGIKEINIFVRKNLSANWVIVKTFDPLDPVNYGDDLDRKTTSPFTAARFEFCYEGQGNLFEAVTDSQIFSNVPIISKAVEVAENRPIFGNNLLGYDNPTALKGLTLSLTDPKYTDYEAYPFSSYVTLGTPSSQEITIELVLTDALIATALTKEIDAIVDLYIEVDFDYQAPDGTPLTEDIVLTSSGIGASLPFMTFTPSNDKYAAEKRLAEQIYVSSVPIASNLTVTRTLVANNTIKLSIVNTAATRTITNPVVNSLRSKIRWAYNSGANLYLAPGSTYNVCAYFFDKKGRTSGALGAVSIDIPQKTLDATEFLDDPIQQSYSLIEWSTTTSFEVPTWAEYVSFGISQSVEIENIWYGDIAVAGWVAADHAMRLNTTIGDSYTFSKGDILRVFNDSYEIVGFEQTIGSDSTGWVIIENSFDRDNYPTAVFFEVVRLKTNIEDNFYFESSQRYLASDFTSAQSGWFAAGEFTGEIYQTKNSILSSPAPGRFIPVIENSRQRRIQNLVYGNKYFENTKINGMNMFLFASSETIDDAFGSIQKMVNIGGVVKIYQDRKQVSIYINKSQLFDSTGTTNIGSVTSSFLGSKKYSFSDYGTIFPESVVKNDRYVYFFDHINGAVLRDSANGIFPISGRFATVNGSSDYKMDKYFKDFAKTYIDPDPTAIKVHMSYDQTNELLIIQFYTVAGTLHKQLGFHEPSNRWVSFYDMYDETPTALTYPSLSFSAGNDFFTFQGLAIWKHNANNRCNFFGIQKGWSMDVVSNSTYIRLFDTIFIHINREITNSIYVDDESTEISDIQSAEYKLLEGVYKAQYFRNKLTTQAVANVVDKYNGTFLRGYTIINRLSIASASEKIELFKVDVNTTTSKS